MATPIPRLAPRVLGRADFETAVTRGGGRLFAVARRFFGDDDDARDALHDALLAGYRARAGFAGEAQLSTWLHRVVVNACLMRLRARRRRRDVPAGDALPALAERHAGVASAEALLGEAETRALVRRAVAGLRHEHRVVVELHDLGEHDAHEVAAALGITPGAVRSRLHRARRALRAVLAPMAAPRGPVPASEAP